ncbi:CRISPR-associated protein, Cas5e family (plasmid) [Euzebya pacifica]|uniref:CRISPR-associated protein, Cas5e family n=1 Tax=Euzebya pacifica TaxID=1608957 RepID=A0A346Y609_9ACTN|nr:type I-E CRISPR-associated protein Cas5/CasD [Euzebya pacifica]AXV09906.1 CRISPR-associated protein, Cas5e family [Euzebya pacifica]
MTTILLRLAAPLMAFGTTSRFDNRATDADPSLSAVHGLLTAAAGITRDQPRPDWITHALPAIRVDRDGHTLPDYQTVNQPPLRRYRELSDHDLRKVYTVAMPDGSRKPNSTKTKQPATVQSRRGYLTDATFLITLPDPTGNLNEALARPRFHLYAGRKGCPVTEPFLLGTTTDDPVAALTTTPTPRTGPDDTGERRAVLFANPADNSRHEDRNDLPSGGRRHRTARRWHTTVTAPLTDNWFTTITHIKAAA